MSGDFLWDLVDAARPNLGDDYDVYVLCAALSCYRTDIYTAVSMVGDKIGDIRRYLEKTLGPRTGIELPEAARVPTAGLPPSWASIRKAPAPQRTGAVSSAGGARLGAASARSDASAGIAALRERPGHDPRAGQSPALPLVVQE
jgi:Protein of unknown function (DUF3606)